MPLKQNSLFYDLSVYLVEQQNYNVLYFNVRENEIWLSKNINKVENIIRIVNKRFDWKNRLKSDIAKVFQRAQSLKKQFTQKTINISNIYITDLEPVDNWKGLLKPLRLQDKLTYNMSVYYLTNDTYSTEINRLNEAIKTNYIYDDKVQEVLIDEYKKILVNNVKKKRRKNKKIYKYLKQYFTYILMYIMLFIYILIYYF